MRINQGSHKGPIVIYSILKGHIEMEQASKISQHPVQSKSSSHHKISNPREQVTEPRDLATTTYN